MDPVRAKKQLGQHFLTDLTIARRICEALTGFAARETLEVGPGMGVLTQYLLERDDLDLHAAEGRQRERRLPDRAMARFRSAHHTRRLPASAAEADVPRRSQHHRQLSV